MSTTAKVPRALRALSKYTVLDVVMGYLPERTQARFRCVSKGVKSMVATHIAPPIHHDMIEDITRRSKQQSLVTYAVCMGGAELRDTDTMIIQMRSSGAGAKHRVRMYVAFFRSPFKVVITSRSKNVKRNLYRALPRHLPHMGMTLAELLGHFARADLVAIH